MGIEGRDWMRSGAGTRPRWVPGRVTWTLIGVNVLLWIVFSSAMKQSHGGLGRFVFRELLLHPGEVFASGKVWQLFTCFWFHDWMHVEHLLFNMLALFFFGRAAESWLGPRRYLGLYVLAGITASLVYALWALATDARIPALGASGAVYAVLAWVACRAPHATVYLFMLLPLPMWLAVGVLVIGLEVLHLAGAAVGGAAGAGAAVAHLAGAAVGALWFLRFRQGFPGPRTAPSRAIRRGGRSLEADAGAGAVRGRVDALLDKIAREGIGALTEEEKSFLEVASRRYR